MNEMKRCAIYTRKSVEEGLDAEFNTLEAQRKYCEAYVADQPGWLALEVVKTLPLHLVQASSQTTLTFKSEEIVIAPETIHILVAIQTARKWKRWLIDGTIRSVYELSQRLNYDKRYIQRRFKLAFISPRILLALLNQNVSLKVSLRKLEDIATLPWPEQEQAVGLL